MKIGIIGCGSIGSRHAADAATLGHDVRIYDPAQGHSDTRFERQMYDTCDALIVSTPSPYHESGIRASIERGKHVLVEKPISTAIGQLLELRKRAEAKQCVVMVGNNLRFHPCVTMAKGHLDNGNIGRPLWATFICAALSTKAPYLSDGIVLNTGAHEVDLALHLLGPARPIIATAKRLEGMQAYGDVIADFVLEHDSGVRSSFHLDFVTPNETRQFLICGSEANMHVDLPRRLFSVGNSGHAPGGSYDDDYVAELKAFVDRINGRHVPGATMTDGIETLKILLAVRKLAGLP